MPDSFAGFVVFGAAVVVVWLLMRHRRSPRPRRHRLTRAERRAINQAVHRAHRRRSG